MKTRDFEPKLRPFLKVFEQIAYRHDVYTVFQDFIFICLNFMGNNNFQEERDSRMKRYKKEEHELFNLLFVEMVKLLEQEIIGDDDWFDCFGNFYQAITSNWKASAMGQFFTPDTVVDMMCRMMNTDRNESKMMFTQAEPACGSGRFVLAAHARNPLGFYWAVDLDPMCVQMTAVNMALHNAVGLVLQANTLEGEESSFRSAYHVARVKVDEQTYLPCIYPVSTFQEANMIMNKYHEYAHYNNLAYHFKEYTAKEKTETAFDENQVLEILEGSPELQEQITPEIKEQIIEKVKVTNQQNQQLSLF